MLVQKWGRSVFMEELKSLEKQSKKNEGELDKTNKQQE